MLTISNMHKTELVDESKKNGKNSNKPNVGIDRSGQMLSYYSALRKTVKWYKEIALHIFEIHIQKAYLLYRMQTGFEITSKCIMGPVVVFTCQ